MKFLLALLLPIFIIPISAQEVGFQLNTEDAYEGYTLWNAGNDVFLIDNCGFLINSWETACNSGLGCYLLDNGDMIRTCRTNGDFGGGGSAGRLEQYNWEGDLIWEYNLSTPDYQQHHDLERLPNGNILTILWERFTGDQAIQAGAQNSVVYWAPLIFELEPIGTDSATIVWEWHMWDHLVQDIDSTLDNYGQISDHPELMNINYRAPNGNNAASADWIHINAIDYIESRDEIVISSRHLDEIYIIDHSTTIEEAAGHTGGQRGRGGDILYRYGNPEAYDQDGIATLFGQHDCKYIPENLPFGGSISVFNNGITRPEGIFSSIDILRPPLDADGNYFLESNGIYGPTELEWTYVNEEDFYSQNLSGAEIKENGNVVICEGRDSRFFEVNPQGEIVWEYISPIGRGGPVNQGSGAGLLSIFRAEKYAPDYPAFDGRDLTPTEPIEIDPLDYDCIPFITTSTDDLANTSDISIQSLYNQLQISNPQGKKYSLVIYDMVGQPATQYNSTLSHEIVNLYDIPQGVYVAVIQEVGHSQYLSYKFYKY